MAGGEASKTWSKQSRERSREAEVACRLTGDTRWGEVRTGEIRGVCREMGKRERSKELAAAVLGADGLMLCTGVLKESPREGRSWER